MLHVPNSFSIISKKRDLYAIDTYFRESWEDWQDILGKTEAEKSLTTLCGIVFKPEAVTVRNIQAGLDYLINQGFYPVASAVFTYNRHIIREVWRYQFNIATRERIVIVDILELATDSLFVLLKDTIVDGDTSASVRLSELKGPSIPEKRKPHQLRFQLGLRSLLLNYVHSPDDTADFVRELGVYFDQHKRKQLINNAIHNQNILSSVLQQVDELYRQFPEHDLSFLESCRRIKELCYQKACTHTDNGHLLNQIVQKIGLMEKKIDRDWQSLLKLLEACRLEVDMWDFIVIATELTESNLPDEEPIL